MTPMGKKDSSNCCITGSKEWVERRKKQQKKCVIMRGISGSGKTTRAKEIIKASQDEGLTSVKLSTDDFFVSDGKYDFDASKLKENHQKNFDAFKLALQKNTKMVIIDNTNTQIWEYSRYEKLARKSGYEVMIIIMPDYDFISNPERNTHLVPIEVLERQRTNLGFDRGVVA